jgi:hypothetical protein
MLTKAETEFGTLPIAALDDAHVRTEFLEWREKIARSFGAAMMIAAANLRNRACPRSGLSRYGPLT